MNRKGNRISLPGYALPVKTSKMKTRILTTAYRAGMPIMLAAMIALSGCAAKKAAWGSLEKGMIMKYAAVPGQDMKYRGTMSMEQKMDVMGQEFAITADAEQLFRFQLQSGNGNNLDYTVTLEEMTSAIHTPRGDMDAKLEGAIGKSFSMTINPWGKELEINGADEIMYDYGMGDMKSISGDVMAFFPDLPGYPVRPGDSWSSTDSVTENSTSTEMLLVFNNTNTFEKLETVNGHECMKINVTYTGTIEGEGTQEGMELYTTGELSGKGTWYYAYKEGIFVKQEMEGTGKTNTQVKGPQEMTIPAVRNYNMQTVLVE